MELKLIELLGKKYTITILDSLAELPKRYSEIKNVCQNDKTRTERLRTLEDAKLITTDTKKIKRKTVIIYRLTDEGRKILKNLKNLTK